MRIPQRFTALVVATLVGVGLVAACSSPVDQMRSAAEEFASALEGGDVSAAAALTSDPSVATSTLTAVFDGLGSFDRDVTVTDVQETDGSGTVLLDVSWRFGDDKTWQYTTDASMTEVDGEWKWEFTPASVIPQMTANQTVRYTPTSPPGPDILTTSGTPLMQEQPVTVVNMTDDVDTAALAGLLSPIAPTITAQSLATALADAFGGPVTAITLRADDFEPISGQLQAMDGVTLSEQRRLLALDRELASPVFGDLVALWQDKQDAATGWAVQLVDSDGTATTVAGQDGTAASDIPTTIDLTLQYAAEAALADVPKQAAIVAIRPSTGDLVAVAQNEAADRQGPIALTGLYPPGSTFKTVTTSAALQEGDVTPDSMVACPGTENIEGRQIPNDDNFDLGTVPLHTAFARSCNTTMGRLAVGLEPDALTEAALQFGLGVDYTSEGMTTVTGSVPPSDSSAARVEAAIGQGTVTASPFGMALVAASIARGSAPTPTLVRGEQVTADPQPTPPPGEVAEQLRSMMREVVTEGTATALLHIPGLMGKTGTAETGTGSAHGWFIGIKGDLAFAVFVAEAGSSAPAVQTAGRFLD
ncbi:MAG: penicillin-binding protein [Rhodococcus sp.]|nr:penicillin-binding protein [Rhodococcus sp. (in: high G+C Gram-positive bacteria)]